MNEPEFQRYADIAINTTSTSLTGEEILAYIKLMLEELNKVQPVFIFSDITPVDRLIRLEGSLFKDERFRILVNPKHRSVIEGWVREHKGSRIERKVPTENWKKA